MAESWGRTRVMTVALGAAATLGLVAPLAPTFGVLVLLRGLQGIALAALPALAMAHVTLVLITVGFFAAHSLASGWVGRRSAGLVGGSPAVAASLYLFSYYAGSSLGGTAGGLAFDGLGWIGVVGYVALLLAAGLALALGLRRVPAAA